MKSPFQRTLPLFWRILLVTAPILVVGFFPSFSTAVEPPDEGELSAMGQGFGKFVGSFMRHMKSEKESGGADPEERPSSERSLLNKERPMRRERVDDDHLSRKDARRDRTPYYVYDPWGASRWGDPFLGYDPWGSNNSWVDRDWYARKRQYGWSYGGDRYPYYGGDRYPYYGGDGPLREPSWDTPFSFGGSFSFGGNNDRWRWRNYRRREPLPADRYPENGFYDAPLRPYGPRDPYARDLYVPYD